MTCPSCKSESWQSVDKDGSLVAVCMDCAELFVPEQRDRPLAQLCDDCAFRPGSPERQDEWHWLHLIEATIIEGSHPFYCHKGLTCKLDGQTLRYQTPEGGEAAMTPCAGWLSRKKAYEAGVPASKL